MPNQMASPVPIWTRSSGTAGTSQPIKKAKRLRRLTAFRSMAIAVRIAIAG
jgi:hypothetical protein